MASHIDPRLYGSIPQPHTHPQYSHQQHQQHQQPQHPHQQPNPQQPIPHPQHPYNTPQPQQLPHIDQLHTLPRHSQESYPPLPQTPYYRGPTHPSPSIPLQHLSDNGLGVSPASNGQYTDEANSPVNGALDANDPKRSRACEACRGLKVRCDQDPNDPSSPCKRCAKAKRQCIITAPSRKRQKKTDSRVAELERKIDALTASLHNQNKDLTVQTERYASGSTQASPAASTHTSPTPPPPQLQSPKVGRKLSTRKEYAHDQGNSQINELPPKPSELSTAGKKRRHSDEPKRPPSPQGQDHVFVESEPELIAVPVEAAPPEKRPPSIAHSVDEDHVPVPLGHRGLNAQIDTVIDEKAAERIFVRYMSEMAQHLPVVVFPPGTKAADVRSTKPILFLAILVAAAIGNTDPEVQQKLNKVAMDRFADCIIRNGEKSLELVQALLISTIWYRPPKRYEQMNFYQYTHIAAVMAIDIGMGKRLKHWRMAPSPKHRGKSARPVLLADTLEGRRTWLGCYFLCSNTSMSLRRPNLVRWTDYMNECIEVLESAEGALPSDKLLCQHVALQHINEEIGNQFSMDDPSAAVTISDAKVQMSLKAFERALDDWARSVPSKMFTPMLDFSKHVTALYMHEVAMHNNHNVDDFRAPFTEESIRAASGQSAVLSPAHSLALSQCVTAVHGIFDAFFAFDLVTVRALPLLYFVRAAYALVVLVKLYFAVTAPNSELGKIISAADLKVEAYVDRLLDIFHTIDKEGAFRPAKKFLIILEKLRDWFQQDKETKEAAAAREPLQAPRKERPLLPGRIRQMQPQQQQAGAQLGQTQQQVMSTPQQQQRALQQQQQQAQHRHQQHLQPQNNAGIANANSPLHFLSEVATNNAQHAAAYQASLQGPAGGNGGNGGGTWYGAGQQQQQQQMGGAGMPGMDLTGLDLDYMGMSSGFEQAMDMALVPGAADGDISSLFMGDPLFSFGMGMGMDSMDGNGMYGNGW